MTTEIIKGKRIRVTKKLLMKLVGEKLVELEIPYEVVYIEKSRFRPQDYESGAYVWKALLNKKGLNDNITIKPFIYSFCSFNEFEEALNNGKKLTITSIKLGKCQTLDDLHITYK